MKDTKLTDRLKKLLTKTELEVINLEQRLNFKREKAFLIRQKISKLESVKREKP